MKFERQVRVHMANRQLIYHQLQSHVTQHAFHKSYHRKFNNVTCQTLGKFLHARWLGSKVNFSLMPPVPDCFTLFTLQTVRNRNNGKLLCITNIQPRLFLLNFGPTSGFKWNILIAKLIENRIICFADCTVELETL